MKSRRWRSSGTRQALVEPGEHLLGRLLRRLGGLGLAARLGGAVSASSAAARRLGSRPRRSSAAGARLRFLRRRFFDLVSAAAARSRCRRPASIFSRARRREPMRGHGQLLRQLALAEDLHVVRVFLIRPFSTIASSVTSAPSSKTRSRSRRFTGTVVRAVRADRHRVLRGRAALLAEAACRSASGRPRTRAASSASPRATSGP